MDHRKVGLGPEDLKKLKALLKEEESKVDAMSEADLAEAERALEATLKKLPGMKTNDPKVDAAMDQTWQRIQKSLNPESKVQGTTEEGKVVDFRKARKSMPWTTVSVFAMAALALLVLYPALQKNELSPGDPAQMQTKGPGEESLAYASDCDIDFLGRDETSIEEAGVGQGYEVDSGADFRIAVKCSTPGYIQLWTKSPQGEELRDFKVEANVRAFVMEEGEISKFNLNNKAEMTLEIALTETEIKTEPNLLDTVQYPKVIGDSRVLWSDSVKFREKK